MKTRWIVQLLLLVSPLIALYALGRAHISKPEDALLGSWLNEEKVGKIQVYRQGNQYFGKLIWLKEPLNTATGQPKTDGVNPDERLRKEPILGLILLRNFTYHKDNAWEGGTIYDARSGKTYRGKLTPKGNDQLEVRGYVGMSWMRLGRTITWARVEEPKKSTKL